jgi:hypothetical protein
MLCFDSVRGIGTKEQKTLHMLMNLGNKNVQRNCVLLVQLDG